MMQFVMLRDALGTNTPTACTLEARSAWIAYACIPLIPRVCWIRPHAASSLMPGPELRCHRSHQLRRYGNMPVHSSIKMHVQAKP